MFKADDIRLIAELDREPGPAIFGEMGIHPLVVHPCSSFDGNPFFARSDRSFERKAGN